VDFRNAVIVMTSNLGSHHYSDPISTEVDFLTVQGRILDEVRAFFRPEFINRLDDIIIFRSLGVNEIKQIVVIQLDKLAARLRERNIELVLSEEASLQLATAGYDPVYGARPLKRSIQTYVVNPLAQKLLQGEIQDGQKVFVDYKDGEFQFEAEKAKV
jgi:ATP-dependent Clp protease ATP-binding subunit ClpB